MRTNSSLVCPLKKCTETKECLFTGTNTKMGSLLTFKLKLTEGQTAGRDYNLEGIEELFVHLHSDAVLELRSDGGILYD